MPAAENYPAGTSRHSDPAAAPATSPGRCGRTPAPRDRSCRERAPQRPELLGDDQRRMIRSIIHPHRHESSASPAPGARSRQTSPHSLFRSGCGAQQPNSGRSEAAPRAARGLRNHTALAPPLPTTIGARSKIATGSTHPTVPDHGGRIKAIKTLLREGLRRVGEAEVVEPRMPTTADEVKDLNWDDFNLVFALTHATEKRAVADNEPTRPARSSRVAAKGTGDRPHSCSSSELPGGSSGVSPGEQNWPRVRFVSDRRRRTLTNPVVHHGRGWRVLYPLTDRDHPSTEFAGWGSPDRARHAPALRTAV